MEITVQIPIKEYERLKNFEKTNREILESDVYKKYTLELNMYIGGDFYNSLKIITQSEFDKIIVEENLKLRNQFVGLKEEIQHWKNQSDKYMQLFEPQLKKSKKWWQRLFKSK